MTSEAIDIYQTYLDVSTRLVLTGESEAYADHVQLPFVFRTSRGVEIIETRADLITDMQKVYDWLASQHVSDYHRIARKARFLDEDTIEGFHVTYALRGAVPVVEPYDSRVILRRAPSGVWAVSFAEHELADALYPNRDSRASHGIFSPRWAGRPADPARDPAQALPLYTQLTAGMSKAASGDDFNAWHALYTKPYTVHYDDGDYTVETPEDVRVFWGILKHSMAMHDADRVNTHPTAAVFLEDDRLLGYHDATLTRDGEVVFGPVRSRMTMTLKDDRWLCSSVANALSMSAFQDGDFVPSPDLPTLREIQQRTKT
jgi:hypothetical protein